MVTSLTLALVVAGCTPAGSPTPPNATPTFSDGKVLMADAFGRTVRGGWGDADLGGAYRLGSDTGMSVGDGVGTMRMAAPGRTCSASLYSIQPRDLTGSVDVIMDRLPKSGYGVYVSLYLRSDGAYYYQLGIRIAGDRQVFLSLARFDGALDERVPLGKERILPFKAVAGQPLQVKFRVAGVTPVELGASISTPAAPATGWQVSASDASASRLIGGGAFDLWTYSSKSTPGAQEVSFDNLLVQQLLSNA